MSSGGRSDPFVGGFDEDIAGEAERLGDRGPSDDVGPAFDSLVEAPTGRGVPAKATT